MAINGHSVSRQHVRCVCLGQCKCVWGYESVGYLLLACSPLLLLLLRSPLQWCCRLDCSSNTYHIYHYHYYHYHCYHYYYYHYDHYYHYYSCSHHHRYHCNCKFCYRYHRLLQMISHPNHSNNFYNNCNSFQYDKCNNQVISWQNINSRNFQRTYVTLLALQNIKNSPHNFLYLAIAFISKHRVWSL